MSRLHFKLTRLANVCMAASLALCGCDVELDEPRISEPQQHVYEYGHPIFFGLGGDSHRFKLTGWSHTEPAWTWTNGIGASLIVQIRPRAQPLTLRMTIGGYVHPPEIPEQPVDVSVNGRRIAQWSVAEHRVYRAVIPAEVTGGPATIFSGHPADPRIAATLYLDFYIPKAQAPALLGDVGDWRRLGISCTEVSIVEGEEPGAATDEVVLDAPETPEGSRYEIGTPVRFGIGQNGSRYKLSGWYAAERNFTWMGDGAATVGFRPDAAPPPNGLDLTVTLNPNAVPPRTPNQRTLVYANGQQIADWKVSVYGQYSARIPPELLRAGEPLVLRFETPDAISPQALGVNADARKLGIALHELVLSEPK